MKLVADEGVERQVVQSLRDAGHEAWYVAEQAPGISDLQGEHYSTTTTSPLPRPNVSGWYISSAFVGGTTNRPGVVARAT